MPDRKISTEQSNSREVRSIRTVDTQAATLNEGDVRPHHIWLCELYPRCDADVCQDQREEFPNAGGQIQETLAPVEFVCGRLLK